MQLQKTVQRASVPLFPPIVTSCITNNIKTAILTLTSENTEYFYHHKDSSCCPSVAISTSSYASPQRTKY